MNKRGQFFLVAATIIIGVLIGLTGVVNSINIPEDKGFYYDLADEVNYETKKVMDFGEFNDGATFNLLTDKDAGFLNDYVNYIGQDQVLFVYGNDEETTLCEDSTNKEFCALIYRNAEVGSVGLNTGGAPETVTIQESTSKKAEVSVNGNKITAIIDDRKYEFNKRQGWNLYQIIIREETLDNNVLERVVTAR